MKLLPRVDIPDARNGDKLFARRVLPTDGGQVAAVTAENRISALIMESADLFASRGVPEFHRPVSRRHQEFAVGIEGNMVQTLLPLRQLEKHLACSRVPNLDEAVGAG